MTASETTALDRLFPASWRRLDDTDPVGPLWRAAQIFRFLTFLYALGFQVAVNGDLAHPALTWALFGLLTAANIWWAAGYLIGFGRHWWFVAIEAAVVTVMMASTLFVAGPTWIAENQTWPTTLWCANAVLSAALLGGAGWGAAAGGLIGVVNFAVKGQVYFNFGRNATLLLLLVTGVAVGLAASRARLTHRKMAAAITAAARAAERERLAREVHDGVLQVLALVARRGREIGGPAAELAALAATQEQRLRRLIADEPADVAAGTSDLAGTLRALAGDRISVSVPGGPVPVPTPRHTELVATVTNVLDNVTAHAGPGAHAFVLLEDLGDTVAVSIRDDGDGIAPGRIEAAAAEGRMGIARSIIGRIEGLGGTALLESAPGAGTEWELTIPLREDR